MKAAGRSVGISEADPQLELFAMVSADRVAQGDGVVVIAGVVARDGWPDLHVGPSNNGLQQTRCSLALAPRS